MSMQDYKNQILVKYANIKPTDREYILIEDGNKAHGLKNNEMRQQKEDLGIKYLSDWPPSSPNFNVIENIWRLLKQRLKT